MKRNTFKIIFFWQTAVLACLFALTFVNEFLDVPHYLFGDQTTTWGQRKGEILIESVIFLVVVIIETGIFRNLMRRIKILEGILPICAGCKKIRHQERWLPVESYISQHSEAEFSHSMCPQCLHEYYPDLYPKK
ncbi:MAG: hypothetical protein M0036_13455 [Desulfobacteraceae bacterium]|nr:hypothetical protein [Desulfobacteraceae bacterium]